MITGAVNSNRQPIVRLKVRGPLGLEQEIDGLVDSGYNGFVTLPPALISNLGLVRIGRAVVTLADGGQNVFDVYEATVLREGQFRRVEADASDMTLFGMALLDGHDLHIRAVPGGTVTISTIP
jgi:predicted aspartyl protease